MLVGVAPLPPSFQPSGTVINASNKKQGIPLVVRWLLKSHPQGVAYEIEAFSVMLNVDLAKVDLCGSHLPSKFQKKEK